MVTNQSTQNGVPVMATLSVIVNSQEQVLQFAAGETVTVPLLASGTIQVKSPGGMVLATESFDSSVASVSGIVTDALGPLGGVEVRVGNPNLLQTINTVTGADGRYAFTPVFTLGLGPWTITFLKLGYQTITRMGVTLVVGNNIQNATMVVVPPAQLLTYISAYASKYHPTWQPPPYYWAGVIYILTVHNPHSVRVTKNLYNWQKTYSGPNISEGPTGFVAEITLAPGETNEFEWYIPLENVTILTGYRTDVWFADDDGQKTPVLIG